LQRFVYVLEGELLFESPSGLQPLTTGGFAYVPPEVTHSFSASAPARAAVIERSYVPLAGNNNGRMPTVLTGHEAETSGAPLMGDEDLQVRTLLPGGPEFDFAVNTMTYQPGASLPMVEVHVMEHGLLMLEGGGIYRLGDSWYPVSAGDFIWMGPYCPQWFGAIGKTPAKYLIYKDWNRHPIG
jgi:(S)-ureidoglycine aminohydrolase